MKHHLNYPTRALISLSTLYTLTIHVNKYILSVLGFTYPTVFQGWQTLVAVILMRVLLLDRVTALSWNSFRTHLLLFVIFVGSIVTGSKALSAVPVPVIIAVSNSIPALETFFATLQSNAKNYSSIGGCCLCIASVVTMFYVDPVLSKMNIASVWLLSHLLLLGAKSIINCMDSATELTSIEKIYYCNLFSVVVLAPSSLYLEEAFQALHFPERSQLGFLIGCALSGISGTLLSVVTINSDSGSINAFAVSRLVSCLVSPFLIPCNLDFSTWMLIVSSLASMFLIHADECQKSNGIKPKETELV